MSQGWFKLYRELFEKAIWQESTPEQKVILIALLGMANHQGKEWEWKGKQFKAMPGQFVTSIDSIIKKCGKGISTQNVKSAIKKFEKYNFLTNESTKTGRLINIVNWGAYQVTESEGNQQTNRQVTDTQPTGNQQVTPNKNDKNNKNVKNDIISDFTDNKLLIKTLNDFVEMRKLIKKPMTDKAKELMLKKLRKLSNNEETQIKILEQSIESSWQGIYPLKTKEEGKAKRYDDFGKAY